MKALYLDEKLEKYYKQRLKPFVKGNAIRPLYEKKEIKPDSNEPILSEFDLLTLDIFTVANANLDGDRYVTKDMVYQFILRLVQEIEKEEELSEEASFNVTNAINELICKFKRSLYKIPFFRKSQKQNSIKKTIK